MIGVHVRHTLEYDVAEMTETRVYGEWRRISTPNWRASYLLQGLPQGPAHQFGHGFDSLVQYLVFAENGYNCIDFS